jgi:ADYC domain
MKPRHPMTRFCIICAAVLCASYCSPDPLETSSDEQFGSNIQGTELQGTQLQGSNIQGMTMQGFGFAGATLNGAALTNVHVDKGELVADQNQVTLHGTSLAGAHLYAQVRNISVSPPTTASVEYRITSVVAETAYDPTNTGSTFLYTLEQNVDNLGSWQPACPLDLDGARVAIPLAATWDETGARVESTTMFTFGCTSGVIAKCYRWGYRPWVTGYGDLAEMHWICTRLARADYCGNGKSHTHDGTLINIWDTLPSPGPIQHWEALPGELLPELLFEAGWRTNGAACLSHARWLLPDGVLIALECPNKLTLPGLAGLGGTACDTLGQALGYGSAVKMFDESYLLH